MAMESQSWRVWNRPPSVNQDRCVMRLKACFENAFWVEQATGLPPFSAEGCRRKRARSPFHPFSKHALTHFLVGLTLLGVTLGQSRAAEQAQPTEYQIKAAFLFNFAKFVEWPATAFPTETSPFCIGILGDDPFRKDLELTISGKKIGNRSLVIKRFPNARKIEFCHILFISPSENRELRQILDSLKGLATLTVGDKIEQFCEQGGMIDLIMAGNKVRFRINQHIAEKAGLKVSSRLLKLGIGSEDPRSSN
ncbi:MAG: YfiR family protein [Verrucomicrobia bacterium]|nr:YfiR family protein [Verrucomicrobiota bacterium]